MKKYLSILAVAVLLLTGCTDEKTASDSSESSESSVITDPSSSESAESSSVIGSDPSEPTESTEYQSTDIVGTDGSSDSTPIEPRKEFPENFPEKGNINGIEYTITQGNYYNANSRLSKKGYYIESMDCIGAPYYYYICSGEKSTGGHDIDVVNIEIDADKNAVITVKTTSPAPEEDVTCAFTYPNCIVTLCPNPKSVVIKDTDGYEYKLLVVNE